MNYENYFQLIGGLGFFFYGIRVMSDSLRKVSSERLKNVLALLTRNKFISLLTGIVVTIAIQSSSALTVMLVGFVNAGLMTLRQAIPVIFGANIGTTTMAWIVSVVAVFDVFVFALPLVAIGFLMMEVPKRPHVKNWGGAIFGFSVLLVGLGFMKDSVAPLQSNQHIQDIMINFGRYPILGVLVGTIMTMVLQSSGATIAIVQVLAFRGLIDFPSTVSIILGDNIGTTITAQLAAIGTNTGAKRVAWAHTMFNVFGVCYMLVFVYLGWYPKLVESFFPGGITENNIMMHIALAHSLFNIANTIVFLPGTRLLQRVAERIVPQKEELISMQPQYLEKRLLETPIIALEQSKKEIIRMLRLADSGLRDSFALFFAEKWDLAGKVKQKEEAVDNLQAEITRYLIDISMHQLDESEAEQIPVLIHSVNDIERIGDHSENILELAQRKIAQKLPFSEDARAELKRMIETVQEMISEVLLGLETGDNAHAHRALHCEDQLNRMQIELRHAHVQRLNDGSCKVLSGLVYLDFVDYLEKIGDHLTNIAQGLLSGLRWETH
ncbi:MAG: Na/Pi cotransporter family protein [Candidatus Krumholzibacteria bacterium]|nr:Na/Pi cotransporter family protein [Candidatus Krumholzibacteria bacterium]